MAKLPGSIYGKRPWKNSSLANPSPCPYLGFGEGAEGVAGFCPLLTEEVDGWLGNDGEAMEVVGALDAW